MISRQKTTTGANDRPKDETIAQSGEGLPDDLSRAPRASDKEIERTRRKLEEEGKERDDLDREVDEEIESSQRGAE